MNTKSINISSETIAKETEKAICIRMSGSDARSGDQKIIDMWFPKSVIKESEIPIWIIIKNATQKGFDSVHFLGCKLGVKC